MKKPTPIQIGAPKSVSSNPDCVVRLVYSKYSLGAMEETRISRLLRSFGEIKRFSSVTVPGFLPCIDVEYEFPHSLDRLQYSFREPLWEVKAKFNAPNIIGAKRTKTKNPSSIQDIVDVYCKAGAVLPTESQIREALSSFGNIESVIPWKPKARPPRLHIFVKFEAASSAQAVFRRFKHPEWTLAPVYKNLMETYEKLRKNPNKAMSAWGMADISRPHDAFVDNTVPTDIPLSVPAVPLSTAPSDDDPAHSLKNTPNRTQTSQVTLESSSTCPCAPKSATSLLIPLKHCLEKTLFPSHGRTRTEEDAKEASDALQAVEAYDYLSVEEIKSTKIGRVLFLIANLPNNSIPADGDHRVRYRARKLFLSLSHRLGTPKNFNIAPKTLNVPTISSSPERRHSLSRQPSNDLPSTYTGSIPHEYPHMSETSHEMAVPSTDSPPLSESEDRILPFTSDKATPTLQVSIHVEDPSLPASSRPDSIRPDSVSGSIMTIPPSGSSPHTDRPTPMNMPPRPNPALLTFHSNNPYDRQPASEDNILASISSLTASTISFVRSNAENSMSWARQLRKRGRDMAFEDAELDEDVRARQLRKRNPFVGV